jgi:hypothetical protein
MLLYLFGMVWFGLFGICLVWLSTAFSTNRSCVKSLSEKNDPSKNEIVVFFQTNEQLNVSTVFVDESE